MEGVEARFAVVEERVEFPGDAVFDELIDEQHLFPRGNEVDLVAFGVVFVRA